MYINIYKLGEVIRFGSLLVLSVYGVGILLAIINETIFENREGDN